MVVSQHRLDNKHDLDWNNVNILDSEHSYYRRMISEMLHIKKQKLNKQSDKDRFPDIYLSII